MRFAALRDGAGPVARVKQRTSRCSTSIGAVAERPRSRRWLAAAAGLAFGLTAALPAKAEDTIKVGILHSLSGTMAISETTLKDVMLMLIDEQNKKGGLLGKKLEAVVVDPASNWPLFAEKARELISKDKVAVVFGCWTSVSRKSVLPVFKELNSILFYPVQYEGEESERNVFYTGAAPNQQAIPAVDYLMSEDGGEVKRWVLEGTDYVYPRTTNKILEAYLKQKGVKDEDIMINYTPFGFSDWQTDVVEDQEVRLGRQEDRGGLDHQRRRQRAVLQGARQPGHQGDRHSGGGVLGRRRRARRSRHQAAGRPSRRLELLRSRSRRRRTPPSSRSGTTFIKNPKRTTNDPMEAHYIGFNMWVKAVEKAGTDRSRQGDRRAARHRGAEPDRRHVDDAAEPPHHQAGVHRRNPRRRPVRRGVEDQGSRAGRRLVGLPAGLEGPRWPTG